jgi:hypothetical protein
MDTIEHPEREVERRLNRTQVIKLIYCMHHMLARSSRVALMMKRKIYHTQVKKNPMPRGEHRSD